MCPCHFFLRRDGVLGISHLVVILFHQCITFCNKCQLYSRWHWQRCTWSDQWSKWIYKVPTFSLLWNDLRESVARNKRPLPECWCFLFPSLHCPLFLMFFPLNFGISFNFLVNSFFFSLVERTFPRIGREFFSTRLGKGSMLRFIGRRHDCMGMHLNEVRKLRISLEAKYSRFVF